MKPANLAAQLAAAETELACLKMALAQVKEDREELQQERDDWRREATKLYAEKLNHREAQRG
jgi:septal ring factor EnvC (AmiA/AmiB activator)